MKLWRLERTDGSDAYDIYQGFVIRAESVDHARGVCDEWATDTTYGKDKGVFADPQRSTCEEITSDGEPGILLVDYKAG